MRQILKIVLLAPWLLLWGCTGIDIERPVPGPVKVALAVGQGVATKTEYNEAAKRFVWRPGDKTAVWAESQTGTFALAGQEFRLMASGLDRDESSACFTSTLASPMAEGTYSYYMTYPVPESVSGRTARFGIPATQDGLASGGVDILVAEPVSGPALSAVREGIPIDGSNLLKVRMKHLPHFLRFYIPQGCNALGEPITEIRFTMPKPVAGTVSVDVTDPSSAYLSDGTNAISLTLRHPLEESADGSSVALAGIFPPVEAYSQGDVMNITVYSEGKWASLEPVRLAGRSFKAGHVTPVPLRPHDVKTYYTLRFTLASNNLGEDPQSIKLALPKGRKWPETSSDTLAFEGKDGALIKVGDSFQMKTIDEAAFKSMSSLPVKVIYESESAIVAETVTLADLSSTTRSDCRLDCPYLFFEDFSEVESFNSNDEYGVSSAGSKSPHTFLAGWSAARAGAQAGTAIRIACRRETGLANYSARADSPLLSGLKEKKTVSLDIRYDYSMNREGKPKISQTVYFGYITTPENPKSGDDTGTFPTSFTVNETTGSYTNINHTASTTLSGVSAPLRLSWRTVPETNWGANNNTCWLYIDNIKVKIKK